MRSELFTGNSQQRLITSSCLIASVSVGQEFCIAVSIGWRPTGHLVPVGQHTKIG